jgi:hypothetical protein
MLRQPKKPVLSRSSGRFAAPEHDDFGADWRAIVEIDDVLVLIELPNSAYPFDPEPRRHEIAGRQFCRIGEPANAIMGNYPSRVG